MFRKVAFLLLYIDFAFSLVFDSDLVSKALNSDLKPMLSNSELIMLLGTDKITKPQLDLGVKLYFDIRMSNSNVVSCNTCHNLGMGGSIPISRFNSDSNINPPTVYNYIFNSQNINNANKLNNNLKDRIKKSLISSIEMNSSEDELINKINSMPDYVVAFKKVYGNNVKIDLDIVADALLAFQKVLFTPSRYDDFLNGNIKALSKLEQEGLNLFIDKGCVSCHNGVNLGGISKPYSDLEEFKFINLSDYNGDFVNIPTLRNILDTAPYMRNGEHSDLKKVIKNMMVESIPRDIDKIFIFFASLSGKKIEIIYPTFPAMNVVEEN